MSVEVLYVIVTILAIGWRASWRYSEACEALEKDFSAGEGEAVKASIAPRSLKFLTYAILALTAAAIGYGAWEQGPLIGGGGAVLWFFLAGIMAGNFVLPQPAAPFWVRLAHKSLVKQRALLAKAGNALASDAVNGLILKMESKLTQ